MSKKPPSCTCAWCKRDLGTIVDLIDHVLAAHHRVPARPQLLD
jgi:hypothetical protein